MERYKNFRPYQCAIFIKMQFCEVLGKCPSSMNVRNIFWKTSISYPLISTCLTTHQVIRNVSFSEYSADLFCGQMDDLLHKISEETKYRYRFFLCSSWLVLLDEIRRTKYTLSFMENIRIQLNTMARHIHNKKMAEIRKISFHWRKYFVLKIYVFLSNKRN